MSTHETSQTVAGGAGKANVTACFTWIESLGRCEGMVMLFNVQDSTPYRPPFLKIIVQNASLDLFYESAGFNETQGLVGRMNASAIALLKKPDGHRRRESQHKTRMHPSPYSQRSFPSLVFTIANTSFQPKR
jgi:hypothetical protein